MSTVARTIQPETTSKIYSIYKLKKHLNLCLFLLFFLIAFNTEAFTQALPASSFKTVFAVDFEDNNIGTYANNPGDWERDWNQKFNWFKNNQIVSVVQKNQTKAMQCIYPKGTTNGENQGTDFECYNVQGYKADSLEMYLSWDVMWKPGFDFVISGKISGGLNGGKRWSHTGKPYFDEGFKVKASWHKSDWNGKGFPKLYVYHHDMPGESGESRPFMNPDNPQEVYFFNTDQERWVNITLRVVVNSVNDYRNGVKGNNDGIVEGYINGKLAVQWTGLRLRNVDTIGINNLRIYSQFGGSGPTFATTRDEWLLTDNYRMWVYDWSVKDVPRHRQLSPQGRILRIPQSWSNAQLYSNAVPTAPTVPTGLHASDITSNGFKVTWTASQDNVGVTGYKIFLNGTQVGTSTSTSYTFSGLQPVTSYNVQVLAYNAAGLESTKSTLISVTTLAVANADTEPPQVPKGLRLASYSNSRVDIQWNASTDNVGVKGYKIYMNGDKADSCSNTAHTFTDLDNNNSYTLAVSAFDASGNESAPSEPIEVNLQDLLTTIYIDPQNTNDEREDGSIDHPFDSWLDVVWSRGYKYLQKRGTVARETKILVSDNDVVLGAYGEGDRPVIWSSSADHAISFFEKSDITISDIHVVAENAISSVYFLGENSDNIVIEKSKFEGSIHGIRIIGGHNYIIRYNTFRGISEAIYSYARNTSIYYNIFQNNQEAVHINGDNSLAEIYNNVFYDNNIAISTEYSELTMLNNIFYLTRENDKALKAVGAKIVSDHNMYYPKQNDFVVIEGRSFSELSDLQQFHNLDVSSYISDPLFVDAFRQNFSLKKGSPAIDAGIDVGITTDLTGENVPFGDKPDIGVIEINSIDNITGLHDEIQDIFRIFPNPNDGVFNIAFDDHDLSDTRMSIHNANGQTILEKNDFESYSGSEYTFDISSFPKGIYFLSVNIANTFYRKKIIKTN